MFKDEYGILRLIGENQDLDSSFERSVFGKKWKIQTEQFSLFYLSWLEPYDFLYELFWQAELSHLYLLH